MAEVKDFLVEIGTEELPPKSLGKLARAFGTNFVAELADLDLGVAEDAVQVLAAPRRLALIVRDLPVAQPNREEQRLGPNVKAAFDAEGKPTRAAEGFAASCGTTVDALDQLETDKGTRLAFVRRVEGQAATALLVDAVARALTKLPVPKPMRWGDHDFSFVRPVHWVVMLLGDAVVDGELLGQKIGRNSQGHRFHHPKGVWISQPGEYVEALRSAYVIVDPAERRELVREGVAEQGRAAGGEAQIREALLDEVTNLVEWPIAVAGAYDAEFLEVPPEALISSMEGHQKFFPVVDGGGALLPRFIGVSNVASTDLEEVARGYGRVIRPRLADARFFWDRDRKRPLDG